MTNTRPKIPRHARPLSRGRVTAKSLVCQAIAMSDLLTSPTSGGSFTLDELRAVSAALGDALLDINTEIERRASLHLPCAPTYDEDAR